MILTSEKTEKLSGVVSVPGSKSYTIRAVVAAALAEGISIIKNPLISDDTKACIEICEKIGAKIKKKENELEVMGVGGIIKNPHETLNTKNSGTTIRLMTAVASLCDEEITLTGDESIQRRPIQPLLDALNQLGVQSNSTNGCPPVMVKGPLIGGRCKIPGDVSSQFISALLMASPLARKDVEIEITTELKSRPYIDLTLLILKKFGIKIENKNYKKFAIPAGQRYSAVKYTVECDYSSAAFLLAAAALTKSNVTVTNLFRNSKQADKKIIEILKRMGAQARVSADKVSIKGTGNLKGITIDLSQSPDLVPIMAVLGSLAKGKTVIKNVEHARLKECDRIKAMATELKKMGADIDERKDGFVINGGKLKGASVDGWRDHRIVMALAVAGLCADGRTRISDAEFVGVTFPNFAELMRKLDANIRI